MMSFKADEGSAFLKMRQFIWMPSFDLRTLNLSPASAIEHRVLVLSQTLHFYIFTGAMPASAGTLELSDSAFMEQQASTEILKALFQMDPATFGRTSHNTCRKFPSKFTSTAVSFILQQEASK